ncbi:MAG: hypothetical protein ACRD2A_03885 [Vicinamibacterales bacterium]
MLGRSLIGTLGMVLVVGFAPADPQRPLAPLPPGGLRVAPFFDGWYANPDASITLSFGYSNLNREELVEIPLGPDNFIEPKEFDGRQPTSFPAVVADSGDSGGRADRRDRARGVFTIMVPSGFKGDVVWTLRHRGQTYRVPGRSKTGAYQLRWPMAMGSIPPILRFKPDGPAGRGPAGIQADPLQASVGAPLSLSIWIADDSVREKDPIPSKREAKAALNVNWYKHSGPGAVVFNPPKSPIAELKGTASTAVTFAQPGEYMIRVRADNFGRLDTSPGNQCCWTNGYVKVKVTPS